MCFLRLIPLNLIHISTGSWRALLEYLLLVLTALSVPADTRPLRLVVLVSLFHARTCRGEVSIQASGLIVWCEHLVLLISCFLLATRSTTLLCAALDLLCRVVANIFDDDADLWRTSIVAIRLRWSLVPEAFVLLWFRRLCWRPRHGSEKCSSLLQWNGIPRRSCRMGFNLYTVSYGLYRKLTILYVAANTLFCLYFRREAGRICGGSVCPTQCHFPLLLP